MILSLIPFSHIVDRRSYYRWRRRWWNTWYHLRWWRRISWYLWISC